MEHLEALLAPLVVLLVKRLLTCVSTLSWSFQGVIPRLLMFSRYFYFTHLGQVDIGNDNLVQRTGSILAGLAGVAVWVVLVGSLAAGLPGFGAVSLADPVLAAGGGRVGAEVPASKTKSAGHDREEDLWDAV